MKAVFSLLPFDSDSRSAKGDFVHVDSASGVFKLTVDEKWVYELNQGDQIKLAQGAQFDSLEVTDLSGQGNNIKLRYGIGSLTPKIDNQKVSIVDLPALALQPNQQVTLADNQKVSVKKAGSYNPIAPASFTGGAVVVPAKATRETLVIITDESNAGKIWVGGDGVGIPLVAGQPFNLSCSAEITLHADINTDTCYLAEISE